MAGKTTKNNTYRDDLIDAVKGDPNHPFNQGIHMEAHHLISSKGAKMSGATEAMLNSDYDINIIENLVFLPATLPGACHLEVQLHRGNHYANESADSSHPRDYHLQVANLLNMAIPDLDKCTGNCEKKAKEARDIIDETSEIILDMIADFEIPLSPIFKSFRNGNDIGCGNCINVKEHEAGSSSCESNRNHANEEHPKFKSGKDKRIIRRSNASKKYTLKVGK